MPLINWAKAAFDAVKAHKLIVLLLLIIAYLYFKNDTIVPLPLPSTVQDYRISAPSIGMVAPELSLPKTMETFSDTTDRIITKTSDLSLLVKDVRETGNQIIAYASNI